MPCDGHRAPYVLALSTSFPVIPVPFSSSCLIHLDGLDQPANTFSFLEWCRAHCLSSIHALYYGNQLNGIAYNLLSVNETLPWKEHQNLSPSAEMWHRALPPWTLPSIPTKGIDMLFANHENTPRPGEAETHTAWERKPMLASRALMLCPVHFPKGQRAMRTSCLLSCKITLEI